MADDWKVIIPLEMTNYVLNPIAQGSANYGAIGIGSTNTPVTNYSYIGYKSYNVVHGATDNYGCYFGLKALANVAHYVTMRLRGSLPTVFDWSLDNTNWHEPTLLVTEGDWKVYGYLFPFGECNGSTTFRMQNNGSYAGNYYVGHIQVEPNATPTTPITGDNWGFTQNGYIWEGTAHAAVSTRMGYERSGGSEVDITSEYNFRVLYGNGIGMPPVEHQVQGQALLPGSIYQGHKVLPRVIDLISATMAEPPTPENVSLARKKFINAIKPDLVYPEQPVVFRYYGANPNKPVDIYGNYDSGLEFSLNQGAIDKPVARFICYDPFTYEIPTQSAVLTTIKNLGSTYQAAARERGDFIAIGRTSGAGSVKWFDQGYDKNIYIAHSINNWGGDVNNNRAAVWNPFTNTLSALGSGLNSVSYVCKKAPDGNIVFVGGFSSAGGVANTDEHAKWNIASGVWQSISTATGNGTLFGVDFDIWGNMYVCGSDTTWNTVLSGRIYKLTPAGVWSALSSGLNSNAYGIKCLPNGDVVVVGQFTTAGGTSMTGVAIWEASKASPAWKTIGSISGGTVVGYGVDCDKAGNIYIVGNFTAVAGVSALNIAKYNGKNWEPLGSGLSGGSGLSIHIDDYGRIWVTGAFTSAGGLPITDKAAMYNGSSFVHIPYNAPGTGMEAIKTFGDELYLGFDAGSSASYGAYQNNITSLSSTDAYPVFHVKRTGGTTATVEYLRNDKTLDTLYLNYDLLDGEELVIDFRLGRRTIYSSMFGEVWRAILRGSDFEAFRVLQGNNLISCYVATSGSPTVTSWMEWKVTHWGFDMVAA